MDFASASENTVQLVWWIGVATNALVVLMMLQVLAFRAIVVFRERTRRRVEKLWKPILLDSLKQMPQRVPRLKRRDVYEFLTLWNYLHESLPAEEGEKLNAVARMIKVLKPARRFLKQGRVRKSLMAMTALGNMRDLYSWQSLVRTIVHKNGTVSLTAAQALVRINAEEAVKIVVPMISSRPDWSLEGVAAMLKIAGTGVVSQPLSRALIVACRWDREATDKHAAGFYICAPRLIYLLQLASPDFITYCVRFVLLNTTEVESIVAALNIIDDPMLLPAARDLLGNSSGQVRAAAAQTIGRLGTGEDAALLAGPLGALHDSEWWVRYRTAEALASLPSMSIKKLEQYADTEQDLFSRDIIRHVLAERSHL